MHKNTAIFNGASIGIVKVTALELAKSGCHVIMVCRNKNKSLIVVEELKKLAPNGHFQVYLANLSSIKEIIRVATEIKAEHKKIDILINNAGAYFSDYKLSVDGNELTLATNHIPYFLLTRLLLPLLKKSAAARIINVASQANKYGSINFNNFQCHKNYNAMKAYANTKLYNIMHMLFLAKQLCGTNVSINAMHPGGVDTGFAKDAKGLTGFIFRNMHFMLRKPEKGAETLIWLALSNKAEGFNGKYFYDKKEIHAHKEAYITEYQETLIKVTEELINHLI